jgi:hypothetical protein
MSTPLLHIVSLPTNDLARVIRENGIPHQIHATQSSAIDAANQGDALLLLAETYPETQNSVDAATWRAAKDKQLRMFVEYPAGIPGISTPAPRRTHWERAVVVTDQFGADLQRNRILAIHGCQFIPMSLTNTLIAIGRVAGFDRAVFGPARDSQPILGIHALDNHLNVMLASTKLSCFVRARYAPTDAWKAIWTYILRWLAPDLDIKQITWDVAVRPMYTKSAPLPPDAEREALRRGIEWFYTSRMLVHSAMLPTYNKPANGPEPASAETPPDAPWPFGHRTGRMPSLRTPIGDGSLGILEGFDARIFQDGTQPVRWWIRADCCGEVAGAMAAAGNVLAEHQHKTTAQNLGDWLLFRSPISIGDHENPKHPAFGLLGWNASPAYCGPGTMDGYGVYYGDDNARTMLGMMLAGAMLGTQKYAHRLAMALLGNMRLTGIKGFLPDRIDQGPLEQSGWHSLHNGTQTSYSPHMQATMWCCFLWAYRETHDPLFLERAKAGITATMAAYPDRWVWMNGIQQERAKMLLALAWLVRVEPTKTHTEWLRKMAAELLRGQDTCGAIREEIGEAGKGGCPPPASNEAYGTAEAPLIQTNADTASDMLYTCNFAFLALHEAAGALSDPVIKAASDKLATFLCRIQIHSKTHPELHGGWFRAFDFTRWEYWASSADAGWGAWSIETGWTQSWITAVFALRIKGTTLWDVTRGSDIRKHWIPLRAQHLPRENKAQISTRHDAFGKKILSMAEPSPDYKGRGEAGILSGVPASPSNHREAWLGFHGTDFSILIDLGKTLRIDSIVIGTLTNIALGIMPPLEVQVSAGSAPDSLRPFGALESIEKASAQTASPVRNQHRIRARGVSARYFQIDVRCTKTLPTWHPAAGQRAWLFIDNILVNPSGTR